MTAPEPVTIPYLVRIDSHPAANLCIEPKYSLAVLHDTLPGAVYYAHPTLESAAQETKERLEKELKAAQDTARSLRRQLKAFERGVKDPGPVRPVVEASLPRIVRALEKYKKSPQGKPSLHKFGRLHMAVGYMGEPGLLTFQVVDTGLVRHTFDEESIVMLIKAVSEVFHDQVLRLQDLPGRFTYTVQVES